MRVRVRVRLVRRTCGCGKGVIPAMVRRRRLKIIHTSVRRTTTDALMY